jgi:hypothetical protein
MSEPLLSKFQKWSNPKTIESTIVWLKTTI